MSLSLTLMPQDAPANHPYASDGRLQEEKSIGGSTPPQVPPRPPRFYRSPYYFEPRAAFSAAATSSLDVASAGVFTNGGGTSFARGLRPLVRSLVLAP